MSTKTTFKRIALVAVSALGFGLMSVVPASANDPLADTLAAASTSVSASSGVAAKVAVTTAFLTASSSGNQSATRMTALLTSAPEGNTAVPVFETATVTGYTDAGTPSRAGDSEAGTTSTMVTRGSGNSTYTKATYNLSFTPVKTGTYTVRLSQAIGVDAGSFVASSAAANAQPIIITYTVAAKPEATAAGSTEVITAVSPAVGNDTIGVSAPITTLNANIATIAVTVGNGSTSAALANGDVPAITASTDRGLVTWTDGSSYSRTSVSSANGNLAQTLYVRGDGSAGKATITFSYVNAAGATVVLGTKSLNFFGAVATLTATTKVTHIAPNAPTSGVVEVVAKDANGVIVPNVSISGTPSSTTAITSVTPAGDADNDGAQLVQITTASTAAGAYTVSFKDGQTPAIVSNTVTFTVAKITAKTVTITTDKATYLPGEKVTVTVTGNDSNGNGMADGGYALFASGGITSSVALQGNLPTGTDSVALVSGKKTYTIYAPLQSGTVLLTATEGSATDSTTKGTITGSFVVDKTAGETAAEAATDAALEAIDAANAAVDAANQATEAADAATVAAEEARDAADAATAAVEALAADVAKMINEIKAQLAAMAKTIATIAKRVKK